MASPRRLIFFTSSRAHTFAFAQECSLHVTARVPSVSDSESCCKFIAAASLAAALVSVSFVSQSEPALELTMKSVTRWVCMGCQQRPGAPGPWAYHDFKFEYYKSAALACHCD